MALLLAASAAPAPDDTGDLVVFTYANDGGTWACLTGSAPATLTSDIEPSQRVVELVSSDGTRIDGVCAAVHRSGPSADNSPDTSSAWIAYASRAKEVVLVNVKILASEAAHASKAISVKQVWAVECPKRPSCILFSPDGLRVIWSDFFGDIYWNPVESEPKVHGTNGKDEAPVRFSFRDDQDGAFAKAGLKRGLIGGHFAAVFGIDAVAVPGRTSGDPGSSALFASCDRERVVRIARLPDIHIIESFCLGHTDLVLTARFVSDQVLATAGADGTVRLWRALSGELLDTWSPQITSAEQDDTIISNLQYLPEYDILVAMSFNRAHLFFFESVSRECVLSNASTYALGHDSSACFPQSMAVCGMSHLFVSFDSLPSIKKLSVVREASGWKIDAHPFLDIPEPAKLAALATPKTAATAGSPASDLKTEGSDKEAVAFWPREFLHMMRKKEGDPEWKGKKARPKANKSVG
ncbi:tRNA (guanine-N(7)-)-methyltransferase non-catalytic subunit TRM82 [Porphyridium purpureum]|uniref:tRNA (Guanine-N(7)-)-methyltransferase non-catalytic subunit TRM82 n=1 Tax=Porphyridium purpureum TaxID=35688 RepID=A0A5J4YRP3_PORPP|nr:tRNA (guanine-N(7)-)-methyltransferase non-catalytic subunit TRM82 [Porphyridium purpureum]|eukprot:POR8261..scf229_5